MAAPNSEERDVRHDDALNKEMEEELKIVVLECGNGILKPGDSVEELLRKLDAVFELKPTKEALISNALLRHDEVDVRVTVVPCITEIIRMTAPNEPINEDQMKDFFKLVNTAYRKLPSMAGRNHAKAVSIIQAVSACQICVRMLDFDLHNTILEMFHLFLDEIQSNHPKEIFSSMEHIMTLIIQDIEESDEFMVELTKIFLAALKKENKNISPCAFQLARKVFEKCADSMHNFVPEAVRHMGDAVQEYDDVIVSSFLDATQSDNMDYDDVIVSSFLGATPSDNMNYSKRRKHSLAKKALGETSKGKAVFSDNEMGDIVIKASKVNHAKKGNGEELVGCKIKLWWPLDERYYGGKVKSFDHFKKTHQVDCNDGETEILDLTKER